MQMQAMDPACAHTLGETIAAVLLLLAMHGPLLFFAFALACRLARDTLDRFAAAILIYLAAAAIMPWALPRLTGGWLLAGSVAIGIVGIIIRREFLRARLALTPALAGWLTFALVSLALWLTKTRLPYIDHDPLTYQLHFAASWLREGRIFIVPTPFGDPSQAYGPAAASLFYTWLMAPLRADLLAVTGALPFYLLSVLAAAALARELGARPDRLWAAAIFATGVVSYQGFTAMTDVAVAAGFAAALAFALTAARHKSAGLAALAALATGLMLGVKISGLTLLPLVLPALAWAGWQGGRGLWRGWAAGAAAGAAVGLPWYVRNLILTGNPVFPLRLGPLPGMYGRDEMLVWVFHYSGWAKWWEQLSASFAPQVIVLFVVAAGYWLYELRRMRATPSADRRPPRAVIIYLLLLPVLIDRLIWWVLPYQELRFWAPIMPLMMAVMAAGFSRQWWLLLLGFAVTSYTFDTLINLLSKPAETPWPAVITLGTPPTVVAVYFGLTRLLGRAREGLTLPAWSAPLVALLLAAAAVLLLLPGHTVRERSMLRYYENYDGWVALPCAPTTVAYAGANVPYPLFGPRLQNRVLYVSPAGEAMPRDHEVWRALAEKPRFRTAEPAVSRLVLCPRRWVEGLRRSGVQYLLVMRVASNELYNVDHDREGWPTERTWADAAPQVFRLAFEDKFSRLYALNPAGGDISGLAAGCRRRPADAPTAGFISPEVAEEFFPRYRRPNPR